MQALVLDKDTQRLDQSLIALMKAGIHVTGTSSIRVAETCITRMCVDLLVFEKSTVGDALGDTLGMAEDRNPHLVSILRTLDVEGDQDDLTPYFPSLHCILGLNVPSCVAVKFALASLRAQMTVSIFQSKARPAKRKRALASQTPLIAHVPMPRAAFAEAV